MIMTPTTVDTAVLDVRIETFWGRVTKSLKYTKLHNAVFKC